MNKEIFEDKFCDGMKEWGTTFVDEYASLLFRNSAIKKVQEQYVEMMQCFEFPENEWKPKNDCTYNNFGDLLIPVNQINDETLTGRKNIGIDLPVWFNSSSKRKRILIVAMEPRRDEKASVPGFASLSTPFALAKLKTIKNRPSFFLFYKFVGHLVENKYAVYVTDIGKIYSENEKGKKDTGDKKLNQSLFQIELKAFKPDIILAFGKNVSSAVEAIIDECAFEMSNEPEYFPHPASRVKKDYNEKWKLCLEKYGGTERR